MLSNTGADLTKNVAYKKKREMFLYENTVQAQKQ